MLHTVRERIAKMKASGKSLAEIQAAKPTAEFDKKNSEHSFIPVDKWVAMIHATLP